jgi:hypothetical protein
MTTDQTAAAGIPEVAPRRWGPRETAVAVGVAAVIAGLGGAAICAATDGSSHVMGGPRQVRQMSGPSGPHAGVLGAPGEAAGSTSLHGEFVVPDGAGGYTTELTQTGTVTAVSPTSITVRSVDSYSQTYVIPPTAGAAGAPFAVDDQVIVRATRTGQTATVTSIGRPRLDGPSAPLHPN